MATSANPVLFADDTSMIITNPEPMEFTKSLNTNSTKINRWFKSIAIEPSCDLSSDHSPVIATISTTPI